MTTVAQERAIEERVRELAAPRKPHELLSGEYTVAVCSCGFTIGSERCDRCNRTILALALQEGVDAGRVPQP